MNAEARMGMQFLSKLGFRGSVLAVLALLSAGSPSFADGLDFKHAWREYEDARAKRLPRSATNVLWRIEREACAVKRWPDALKAFTARFDAEREFNDDLKDEWIPELERRIASAPDGIRLYLDLYLASVYAANPDKWAPDRLPASIEALFARVLKSADALKREPVSNWDGVLGKGNMPDSCRPTLYDLAVHHIIDFYGRTIPDKTLEKGLKLLDDLIAFHSADGNADALADATLRRIRYENSFIRLPPKAREAKRIAALEDYIAAWTGKSDVVALAVYERAEIDQAAGRLVAARERALQGAARWPKSVGGRQCAALVQRIDQPTLALEAERIWARPLPKISVKAANMDTVHFKLVKVSHSDVVNYGCIRFWSPARDDTIRGLCQRKGVRTWSARIERFTDYAVHTTEVDPPTDVPNGQYLLVAGMDDKFDKDGKPFYATFVQVTDLALAVSDSDGAFYGTVFQSEAGTRVRDAKVELWGTPKDARKLVVLKTGKTDADGAFVIKPEKRYASGVIRVVAGESEILSENCSAWRYGSREPPPERISVITDRALYRPGQKIQFKGYAHYMDRKKRDFRVLAGARVELNLYGPNRKPVGGWTATANEWGTFVGEFTAPRDRLTGWYSINARFLNGGGETSVASIRVEEYKRPKFEVGLGTAPTDAALGKEVEIVGTAKTYSGLPAVGAKVKWTADRMTRYAPWFWGFDERDDNGENQVDDGETVTDEKGEFRIRFTPVADPEADLGGEPSFLFNVNADVTDTTGETRSIQCNFEIGTVAWRAAVEVSAGLSADAPVKASVQLSSLSGGQVSAAGTLRVFALKGPASPVRRPVEYNEWGWRMDREKAQMPQPWNWKTWNEGDEVKSVPVEVKDGGWSGEIPLPAGAYRLKFETVDPQGKTVRGQGEVAVVNLRDQKLGFAAPSYFAAERHENGVTVGTHLRYVWASGYQTGVGRMEIFSNGTRIFVQDSDPSRPYLFADYEVTDRDRGRIECRVTFLREGRLYADRNWTSVPWDNKVLKIEREHFTSKLETGAKEKWTFRVSGPSEVLAFMYDKSLDAYAPYGIGSPFGDFSESGRYLPSLVSVNTIKGLEQTGGRSEKSWPAPPCWRSLNDVFGRYRILAYGGLRGEMMRCCCASAAAGTLREEEPKPEGCCVADGGIDAAGWTAGGAKRKARGRMANKRGNIGAAVEPEMKVRSNLAETAFFLPHLMTDGEGRVTLEFTAPEAMTGWKLLMLAHDKELRSGVFGDDTITTTRPLMVEPNPPRFVREGDDFKFAVKVTNNTDEPQACAVSLAFEDLASGASAPVGGGSESVELKPHETRSVEFAVRIPDGQGFLKFVAKAVGAKFADGEEGALAVLSRRVEVREAVQLNLRGAGERRFALTNLIESAKNGNTIRSVDLTVRVVSRPAWYAVTAFPYLMEFPHECCEQTFSRCYANALGAWLAKSDPRIRAMFDEWKQAGADALRSPLELNGDLKQIALDATPWVREAAHETAAKRRLGELFDDARMAGEHDRCLAKLEDAITGGLFPWFPGGRGSREISLYILIGFERLKHLGGIECPPFAKGVCLTVDLLERDDVAARLRREREEGVKFHLNGYDLRWLYLHSFPGVLAGDEATVKTLKEHLRGEWTDFGVEGAALAAIVLARGGDHGTALAIMKSLKERAVVSEEFGMYWRRPSFFSCSVFAAPVSMQVAAVEAFKEVAEDAAAVEACNVWIVKQRQTQNWSSTAATVDAIYALLHGGGTDLLAGDALATVTLGGTEAPRTNAERGTGTYSASWRGAEVKPEMGEIVLKSDQPKGIVWGGVNWTYLEDVEKVKAFAPKELRIEKRYFRRIRTKDGERLVPVEGAQEQGDEIVARLRLRSDRTLEYVHVRDERPSCAEPVDVLSAYRWQDGVGYYQSTRDAATHYYIDRLNKGEFVIETSYRVQQRGTFAGGLAQIQCMYAPEFTAHSTSERVQVK